MAHELGHLIQQREKVNRARARHRQQHIPPGPFLLRSETERIQLRRLAANHGEC